jgi:hypothetical protein
MARLTEKQQQQREAGREGVRRQIETGEPLTDSQGQPLGRSKPYTLVPLDQLHFDDGMVRTTQP